MYIVCVFSGSKIALFNRVKSQTVSTRYLAVPDSNPHQKTLEGKPHDWDAFIIWAVDDPRRPSTSQLCPSSGLLVSQALHGQDLIPEDTESGEVELKTPLIYGQKVVLQNSRTGVTTRPVVFCKLADRNWAEVRFQGEFHFKFELIELVSCL